jgi:hypothetical protein
LQNGKASGKGEAKEVFSDRTGGKNWFEYHISALSGKTSLVPQPGGQSDAMTNAFMRLPWASAFLAFSSFVSLVCSTALAEQLTVCSIRNDG